MKQGNVVLEKSYRFALRIIRLYQHVHKQHAEYVLSKQVLRAGTSIGANVEEAVGGQSRKDFKSKLEIAYKEARETKYWLRLLRDSDYLTTDQAESILVDCEELLRLLGSIITTLKDDGSNS
jgi:four helix bundle protein